MFFVIDKKGKYGRQNICKKCRNNKQKQKRDEDARYYLKDKFRSMVQRCYSHNNQKFPSYGGRGITICQEWMKSEEAFVDWALSSGFKRNLQIDRIDNKGGYSPSNCRWVTSSQNCRNKNNNTTNYKKKTRICGVCKVEKPLTEYHGDRNTPLNKRYVCKSCYSIKYKTRKNMKIV